METNEQAQIPVEGGTVEITDQPVQQQAPVDPAELAATTYTMYLPRFQELLMKMSNKQLRRVFGAVIEHPIYDSQPKFSTEEERVLFAISNHLAEAKMAMIMSTMFSKVALDQVDWAKPAAEILDQVVPQDQNNNVTEQNKE